MPYAASIGRYVKWNNEGSFLNDLHKDLKADYLLANPPFNDSDWKGEMLRDDIRWKYGVPPIGNANFAWVQHFIHHLAPHGIAGFVLANGSMSSNTSNEGEIRKNIIEARPRRLHGSPTITTILQHNDSGMFMVYSQGQTKQQIQRPTRRSIIY